MKPEYPKLLGLLHQFNVWIEVRGPREPAEERARFLVACQELDRHIIRGMYWEDSMQAGAVWLLLFVPDDAQCTTLAQIAERVQAEIDEKMRAPRGAAAHEHWPEAAEFARPWIASRIVKNLKRGEGSSVPLTGEPMSREQADVYSVFYEAWKRAPKKGSEATRRETVAGMRMSEDAPIGVAIALDEHGRFRRALPGDCPAAYAMEYLPAGAEIVLNPVNGCAYLLSGKGEPCASP